MFSPSNDAEHIARLLEARSSHHRFPSGSDVSDSPSIYSHAYFSPQLAQKSDNSRSFSRPTQPDRNRLNDLAVSMLDSSSMLDLEEDPRSSYASSVSYDIDDRHDNDTSDTELENDLGVPRMSYLGPKMRVHSKAPWELDDPLNEEDEADSLRQSFDKNTPFHSTSGGKHSLFSRSSNEVKRSFETSSSGSGSNPRGTLHYLAQASLSSTSLVYPTQGMPRRTFASLGRIRSQSPLLTTPPPRSPSSAHSNGGSLYLSSNSRHASPDRRTLHSVSDKATLSYSDPNEDRHPYANPDNDYVSFQSNNTVTSSNVPRIDSAATLTGPSGLLQSRGRVATFDVIPSSPVHSVFQGREISSPIPVDVNSSRADSAILTSVPGWSEPTSPPSFSLISLEEARAIRSRSATVQAPVARDSKGPSNISFPESDSISVSGSISSRARARSVSAGAKAKQAISSMVQKPERRDSECSVAPSTQVGPPGGKSLKHKKSGFMRLFNRDEKSPPPPVPSLSDGYAAFNAQQTQNPRTPKISTHRIPVPQLSPSLMDAHENLVSNPPTAKSIPKPPLSINTTPSNISRQFTSTTSEGLQPGRLGLNGPLPQSAPANISEFPALKLRPVSTLFSAQFGGIISDIYSPDIEDDTPISASPNNMLSPITPGLFSRSDQKISRSGSEERDDQSMLVQSLKEQMVTAKTAWQQQIWELEGQVRDLKAEVNDLRANTQVDDLYCDICGRGTNRHSLSSSSTTDAQHGAINRPRAKTGLAGTNARFGNTM